MTRWLLLALTACGRIGFSGREVTPDAAPDATTFGPWATPQPITAVNTTSDDSDPELSADGLELVFHSRRPGGAGLYDLYHSVRASTADAFPAATRLVELSTPGEDQNPGLSRDALTIVFSDNADIVFATRPDRASAFGPVQPVPALSSTDVDTCPELSGDGQTAMVVRGVTDAREIWMYTRAADGPITDGWSQGTQLVELSSPVADASPDLDLHAQTLHFHSDRIGPTDDIFVTTRDGTTFTVPAVVTEVSTTLDEGDPTLTADLRTMVFHRGLDLYITTR